MIKRSKRGMTYLQIYGTTNPTCGFKKGDKNIAKRTEIRKKISEGLKNYYRKNPHVLKQKSDNARKNIPISFFRHKKCSNSLGEKFDSQPEVEFSEMMIKNGIDYKKHQYFKMIDGRAKIVDFVVGDVIVEISGFVYESWRKDFTNKIQTLRRSVDNPIVVLTYKEFLNDIYQVCDYDIFTGCYQDEKDILEKIEFCQNLYEIQQVIKC